MSVVGPCHGVLYPLIGSGFKNCHQVRSQGGGMALREGFETIFIAYTEFKKQIQLGYPCCPGQSQADGSFPVFHPMVKKNVQ
jgi:hypothetical protein